LCLRIVDIKKNGGKIRDIFKRKVDYTVENFSIDECVGDFEDEDVRIERERVASMCESDDALMIVKVWK
jgi:hypothetical protein